MVRARMRAKEALDSSLDCGVVAATADDERGREVGKAMTTVAPADRTNVNEC